MKQDEKTQLAEVHAALRLRGWTTQQLERGFDGLRIEDAIERGEYILACALKADKKRDEAIFAAIDRLEATDDEKATLRFADWGAFEEEIEADADKAARARLILLREEEEANEYETRRVEGLSYFTCDIVDRWPASAKIRIFEIGAPLVTMTMKVGNAYFAGAGADITEAIWSLDRQWTAGITGARFAVDVLMAISKPKIVYVEDKPKCAHPLCADSDECIDNYDGGDDGDAWSGGFAENH